MIQMQHRKDNNIHNSQRSRTIIMTSNDESLLLLLSSSSSKCCTTRKYFSSALPVVLMKQCMILVVLSLFMIYIDSKSISAYIYINDRPISSFDNVSKYMTSLSNIVISTMTTNNHRLPTLIRGNKKQQLQSDDDDTQRIISLSSATVHDNETRKEEGGQELRLLRRKQQLPLPINVVKTDNEETIIHSITIEENDIKSISTSSSIINDADHYIIDESKNDDELVQSTTTTTTTTNASDPSQLVVDEDDNEESNSINQQNDRLSEDTTTTTATTSNEEEEDKRAESLIIHSTTDTITNPDDISQRKVLCLSGDPYGRTMNQYLQLATILHQLGINGTTVVAFKNPYFTSFYNTWFEPRNDIIIQYDINAHCDAEYDAVTLHYLYFADKWKQVAYQFETLIPKSSIRIEAERAMLEYTSLYHNQPITTVHRRDLEGACVLFAENKNLVSCPNIQSTLEMSSTEYRDACLIDYNMIMNATRGTTVVLYTDGQVPELDSTFPIISHHPFPIQAWMMAISDIHYGNPFSTVDLVVYFWRMALATKSNNNDDKQKQQPYVDRKHMLPSACYKPTPDI